MFSVSDTGKSIHYHLDKGDTKEAFEKKNSEIEIVANKLDASWTNLANLLITIGTTVIFGSFIFLNYKKIDEIPWCILFAWVCLLLAICLIVVGKILDLCFQASTLKSNKRFLDDLSEAIHTNCDFNFNMKTYFNFASIKYSAIGFLFFLLGILFLAAGIVLFFIPQLNNLPIIISVCLAIILIAFLLREWYKFEND